MKYPPWLKDWNPCSAFRDINNKVEESRKGKIKKLNNKILKRIKHIIKI